MNLPEPSFDKEGYPSEEFLQSIENYDGRDVEGMLALIQEAWRMDDWALHPRPGIYVFATGGWSGNEDLINAFNKSMAGLIANCHSIQFVGGFYCFTTTPEAQKELEDIQDYVRDWAVKGVE